MKVRILNNSLRLRLSQSEVSDFFERGKVEARIQFGSQPNEVLIYSLEKIESGNLSATFFASHIQVFVPEKMGDTWATSNEVGMEGVQKIDEDNSLRILVEKDFKCLTVRPGEDESGNFPNPSQSC